jgi:hypothetical protein
MRIFVATRPENIPADAHPFVSVDGTVPGAAATWDHHVTGEPVNLDAMPDTLETVGLRGIGTTLADTDAAASVLAVLAGGRARLDPSLREVLYAASYRCDHLRRAPGVSDAADATGQGLHHWVVEQLQHDDVSAAFEGVCRELWRRVEGGEPLPSAARRAPASVTQLRSEGRVRLVERVACFDLRDTPAIDPEDLHAGHDRPVAVIVRDHASGGVAYTVGVNPFHPAPPTDLGGMLVALAQAEFARGAPCRSPEPKPGAENWGGRATVFGSPWNYGSRLSVDEVVAICGAALGGA